ncbi:MAG: hypothetical protein ACUVQ1_04305 [Candidatus Kapaibacteriales bacterium]
MKPFYTIFISIFLFFSCSLFQTRNPEEPEPGNQSFPPAVSPQIAVDNFVKSFSQKNIVAYFNCFSDEPKFQFVPSSDALNIYPGIFENWGIEEEKLFATNLFNKFLDGTYPVLVLSNTNYNSTNPDSTLFFSDYKIEINSTEISINQNYIGKLQFTLVQNNKGIWAISRWIDFNSGTLEVPSISTLKAKLKL